VTGGYPEALTRQTERRRSAWFHQYIEAIIQRDVREITEIVKPEALQKLLRAFAHSAGQLTNYSEMGGAIALDHKTVSRYLSVLEAMYLARRVPPYFSNRLKRILKTPKVQFLDAGILSNLIGTNAERMKEDRTSFGPVLESFVYSELLKHASVSEEHCSIMHYRDRDKTEVDFVVERPDGGIVAVEVKAAATVRDADLRGLKRLLNGVGSQLRMGIVLYDGTDTMPVGDRLYAGPISSLWA
jgi:predicted AAA+ superfamily ATPase